MTSFLKKSASKVGRSEEPSTPEEEQTKVNELRDAIGPLTGRLEQFVDDACLKRYLRARNWNLKKSEKMLKDTLAWRESFKPEDIRWADVSEESETGKLYRANFKDKTGHTVLVMHPGRQNTTNPEMQIKQLVYFLENAILNLPEGQEQMIWLIDFKGWSMKKSSPISVARETVNLLQNHYPERLDVAILYNPPRLFEAFWTIIKPFLDPKTFKKVKFVYSKNADSQKIMTELFEEDAIKSTFEDPNDYMHAEYAKMMQDDDQKSSLHWKLAGVAKPEQELPQEVSKDIEVPSVEAVKTEDTASVKEEEVPAADVTPPEEAPVTPPVATLVAAPAPVAAPVVAPVS